MFYAYLHFSKDGDDMKNLFLKNHIVVKDYLFKDILGSEFSCEILYEWLLARGF